MAEMQTLMESFRAKVLNEAENDRFNMEYAPSKYFIRFGKFGTTSRMGLDQEFKDELGGATSENGVSVYFARPRANGGGYSLMYPEEERARYGLGHNYMSHMIMNVLDVYDIFLVSGQLLRTGATGEESWEYWEELEKDAAYQVELAIEDGDKDAEKSWREEQNRYNYLKSYTYDVGSDGEPVIRDVEIIKRLSPDGVYESDNGPSLAPLIQKRKEEDEAYARDSSEEVDNGR